MRPVTGPRRSSERLEAEIEQVVTARTGRPCPFMPSGRLGLHLAFRALLAPGDRILMSPLEDAAHALESDVAPEASDWPFQSLLRVPLLVRDRDATAAELMAQGLNVYFLYDPPLDYHAPTQLAERSPLRPAPGSGSVTSSRSIPATLDA